MLDYAEQLTLNPSCIGQADVDALKVQGWSEPDITNIVHIVGMFNYLVRLADGLGLDIEPEDAPYLTELTFHRHVSNKAVGNSSEERTPQP
jgi:hypothetical protein